MKKQSLEAFLDACGGHGPLHLDVTPPTGGSAVRQVLHQPFALLGRHERADVCLQDSGVSRRHALVQMIAGRFYCLDLGSRTGTHWDGKGQSHGWLPGQVPFRVGPYRLWLAGDGPDSALGAPDGWDPFARGSLTKHALPSVTLNISNNGTSVSRWRMNRVLALVGDDETCKVRLRGPGVSNFHCGLVCTPAGVWVIDLQRHGGVSVNRTPVMHSLLEDGDQLQIGSFTISVGYDSAGVLAQSESTGEAALLLGHASRPSQQNLLGNLGATHSLNPWRDPGSLMAPPSPGSNIGAVSGEAVSTDLLSGIMRQLSQSQHQMFDQSLVMMFQMFRAMHVEQVGILREELGRLDALNQELQDLLAERLKSVPAPIAALPPATEAERTSATRPPASAVRPTPVPTTKQPVSQDPASVAGAPPAPRGPAVPPSPPAKTVPGAKPTAPAGEDVHIWLCQRMEAIQQERQGIWERIVGVLKKPE